MSEIDWERGQLQKADDDILQGRERIARQMDLIDRLRRHDHPVEEAEKLLWTMEETLEAWQAHRSEIIVRLAHLEKEAGRAAGGDNPR